MFFHIILNIIFSRSVLLYHIQITRLWILHLESSLDPLDPFQYLIAPAPLQLWCRTDMKKAHSFVFFLTLVELYWVSLHLLWFWLLTYCKLPLLHCSMLPLPLISLKLLSQRRFGDCQTHFGHWERWTLVFFQFFYMVDYIDRFLCIESSLHHWKETCVVMVDAVFLDSVCKYFIEYFCINIHMCNWPEILFTESLCVLGGKVVVAS